MIKYYKVVHRLFITKHDSTLAYYFKNIRVTEDTKRN